MIERNLYRKSSTRQYMSRDYGQPQYRATTAEAQAYLSALVRDGMADEEWVATTEQGVSLDLQGQYLSLVGGFRAGPQPSDLLDQTTSRQMQTVAFDMFMTRFRAEGRYGTLRVIFQSGMEWTRDTY